MGRAKLFEVGQHVVCIADLESELPSHLVRAYKSEGGRFPVKGTVYTVRAVYVDRVHPDVVGIMLVEIVNPPLRCSTGRVEESGFDVAFFRPLKKLKVEDFMGVRIDENA